MTDQERVSFIASSQSKTQSAHVASARCFHLLNPLSRRLGAAWPSVDLASTDEGAPSVGVDQDEEGDPVDYAVGDGGCFLHLFSFFASANMRAWQHENDETRTAQDDSG